MKITPEKPYLIFFTLCHAFVPRLLMDGQINININKHLVHLIAFRLFSTSLMYVPTLLVMDLDIYEPFLCISVSPIDMVVKGWLNVQCFCFWHLSETLEFVAFEECYIKRKETYKASATYCKRRERNTEKERQKKDFRWRNKAQHKKPKEHFYVDFDDDTEGNGVGMYLSSKNLS